MTQQEFARKAAATVKTDSSVIGLAVAGSWLTAELDEYSDLDLILVTKEKIAGDTTRMLSYAQKFGELLTGFTGEHVGEPRLLICLYKNPLLHVDIKFLTVEEFSDRIETPVILADTDDQLQTALDNSQAKFPYPEYQWIEDRFWIWIHYALLKIGRGEYFEAYDSLGFLRTVVFGPLLHIKNGNLPRGVRKVETQLTTADLVALKETLAEYEKTSLLNAFESCVKLYRGLRSELFDKKVMLQKGAELQVLNFMEQIKQKKP
ncbi:nucleotidyltransferase domain-containing protein [Terrimonas pollutisoli]|uniref:nucleotidyltransferase domain-containing protein n=1 Tax=Terrimonas pollutisoli TaxID=3034147 RepID=UPI0023EA8C36|nr:nucleotidyltransferase domain-containing protein [Terrimonas sp. H1YJ31]